MPEEDKAPEKPAPQKPEEAKNLVKTEAEDQEDTFDFGGIPAEAPFKRNIGCGG